MGKPVVFDGAPDCRCYRGELVVGEVNCRHGPDIIGRHLSSKEMFEVTEPGVSAPVKRIGSHTIGEFPWNGTVAK